MKYEKVEQLPIWKLSMNLVKELYLEIKNNKNLNKDFALQEQIKRSVISIPSNISEWFWRKTWNEFVRFLDITLWSLYEFKTQVYICREIWYISNDRLHFFLDEISKIERQIKSLILYLNNN